MEMQKHGFVLTEKGGIMMTDREKVIKGIGICLDRFHCSDDCPYYDSNTGCMEQLRDDALELLKEQEPSGWISVKDRLPVRPPDVCGLLVRRNWYLVALESGAVLSLSYEFDEDRWQGVGSPVTHWMPLPAPPKEDDDHD